MDIKVNTSQLAAIDEHLRNGRKIDAIKHLRSADQPPGKDQFGYPMPSRIGLKEAKEAVERREWELDLRDAEPTDCALGAGMRRGRTDGGSKIILRQPIRRIICDFGDGEVELDMDGLSLRSLMGLNGSIGINDALELVDLYRRIKEWDDKAG
jgi:hypothetical protein